MRQDSLKGAAFFSTRNRTRRIPQRYGRTSGSEYLQERPRSWEEWKDQEREQQNLSLENELHSSSLGLMMAIRQQSGGIQEGPSEYNSLLSFQSNLIRGAQIGRGGQNHPGKRSQISSANIGSAHLLFTGPVPQRWGKRILGQKIELVSLLVWALI